MNILLLLLVSSLLLCSCNIEDTPPPRTTADFSSSIRDYALSAEAGKTMTFVVTNTLTDTAGKVSTTRDTVLWTIINRNASHPEGGNAIEYTEKFLSKGTVSNPISYFMVVNDNTLGAYQGTSSSFTTFLKSPLRKGTSWRWKNATSPEYTISDTSDKITLPTGTYAAVRAEAGYEETILSESKIIKHRLKNFLAQGVIFCKAQEEIDTVFASAKKSTLIQVMELRAIK